MGFLNRKEWYASNKERLQQAGLGSQVVYEYVDEANDFIEISFVDLSLEQLYLSGWSAG